MAMFSEDQRRPHWAGLVLVQQGLLDEELPAGAEELECLPRQ
jgi:hypothetical protein